MQDVFTTRGLGMVFSVSGAKQLLASASMIALLAACSMTPEPLTADQLTTQGRFERTQMFDHTPPLAGPLTVSEAIARALKFNLDRRAKMMEEALALNQIDLDRWDMLPKLAANAGFTSRSEANATRSRDLYTQTTGVGNPTYSTDRDNYTADLGLSWNVLDFGVSYFSARQNADRALVAGERKRKAVHNLVQEVRFAFWRAAAHQALKGEVERAVDEARQALDKARIVERENLKAPADALRYQKNLLETLRQLTAIQQELSTAEIELSALINLPPGSSLVLDVPAEMKVPAWDMALERMEEMAFVNNADLREQGYQERITVNEARKAIARLFPGITFSASRNYDHNSFLTDNRWYEAGAKLSWNLMNLVSAPDTLRFHDTAEEVTKAKGLALRMAVLAQLHIAERQYHNAVSQFQQSDELWKVDKRLFDLSSARTANDAQGLLERVAGRASAIASQLRRFQTYAQVEQAYAKIQTSLGHDLMPDEVASTDLGALSTTIAQRLDAWNRGEIPVVATVPAPAEPSPAEAAPTASPVAASPVAASPATQAEETPAAPARPESSADAANGDSLLDRLADWLSAVGEQAQADTDGQGDVIAQAPESQSAATDGSVARSAQ